MRVVLGKERKGKERYWDAMNVICFCVWQRGSSHLNSYKCEFGWNGGFSIIFTFDVK